MPEARPLTVIVCDPDPYTRSSTSRLAQAAGFDVLAEITFSIEAGRQVELAKPSLVLIVHEQSGLTGLEAVAELRAANPASPPEVVLLTADLSIRDSATELGAFGVAHRTDPEMIERVLGEVRTLLETGERRSSSDRRSGEDRRRVQDWSKVTSERRAGADRRKGLRREDDVTGTARRVLEDQRAAN